MLNNQHDEPGSAERALPALRFPDLPRLELDQLLEQLVERAQEVMGTQGRLRGLLRASQMVTGDLALPTVLRRIAEAAKELVGARYAALGVIGSDSHLAEFVHVGMPQEMVTRIGRLPQGKGLLGALVDDPQPIRLGAITDDPRSSGFPAGHPPMSSFLGVPIRVRGVVFGNLYLAESDDGGFSDEDEELVKALAATAGVAIDNARLYQTASARHKWLQASAAITRRLLSLDAGDPLALIAEHARDNADADVVTVLRPDPTGEQLRIEAAVGAGADDLIGTVVPLSGSLVGRVFTSGTPILGSWLQERARLMTTSGLDVDPVLMVPLIGSGQINGVLTAARLTGRQTFTNDELEMAAAFANQASVSIELAEARVEQQRDELYDERDRIAGDLHTQVIQRLSGIGLSLQAIVPVAPSGGLSTRVRAAISDIDDVIDQIRSTVFQLQDVLPQTSATIRNRLLDVLGRARQTLGFTPSLQLSGQVDAALPTSVTEGAVGFVQRVLDSLDRAGQVQSVDVSVTVRDDRLTVDVAYECPVPDALDADLTAIAATVQGLGGSCRSTRPGDGNNCVVWTVPTGQRG